MKNLLLISLLVLNYVSVSASLILGVAKDDKTPLPFANVYLKGTTYGTASDESGKFMLKDVPPGNYQLMISALGYQLYQKSITVSEGDTLKLGDVILSPSSLGLNEVVVTGTLKESFISESPVKVEVITTKLLEKTNQPNLVRSITMVNGVSEVVACGVCFTNSININGLAGPYTAVLVDGTPMFGNLASVYGLNGIPNTMIDRVEIIKGPNSTLYGSEAMAGVINIITKKPEKQPLVSADVMFSSHRELFTDVTVAPKIGKWAGAISLNYNFANIFEDQNNDGFGDIVNNDRINLLTKWSLARKNNKRFFIAAKYYFEDRRNGVEAFLQDRNYREIRGNDSIYGESIYTHRWELFGTYELPTLERIWVDYSFSWHDQDSYYGADLYRAQQAIGYANFIWSKELGLHDLMAGITARYQYYDDNTVATQTEEGNEPQNQHIPGLFVQDEWQLHEKWDLLAGMRLDYYSGHGLIPAPRLSLKYAPGKQSTLRLNGGTGFRIVNLFTEDHAFVSGNREVLLLEDLKPERSYNVTLNYNQVMAFKSSQAILDVDGFYTYFTNAIIPDYDTPGKIIYANSSGHLTNYGVSVSYSHEFSFPLSYNVGVTWQRSFETESGQRQAVQFVPEWSGVATVSYDISKIRLSFDYTARFTGAMPLPEVYDLGADGQPLSEPRPTQSKPFIIQNIQATKLLPRGIAVYAGVRNLFNYIQPISPLSGYNDPNAAPGFSEYFDTAYAYAPIHGREFYLGVRWRFK